MWDRVARILVEHHISNGIASHPESAVTINFYAHTSVFQVVYGLCDCTMYTYLLAVNIKFIERNGIAWDDVGP